MRRFAVCLFSVAVCSFGWQSTGAAQDEKSFDPTNLDPAVMEKMAAEFAALAPEHELFKKMEGSWSAEVKTFMPDPSQPSASTGTSQYKLMMGGRFIVEHFKGSFEGEEFEGVGVTGYDKMKKKYVGFWFDNMGTGFMQTEGTYDSKTKTMTQTGSAATPMGKMQMKMVSKNVGDDTTIFTMYTITPDGDAKTMEITYKRK